MNNETIAKGLIDGITKTTPIESIVEWEFWEEDRNRTGPNKQLIYTFCFDNNGQIFGGEESWHTEKNMGIDTKTVFKIVSNLLKKKFTSKLTVVEDDPDNFSLGLILARKKK